jgi:hypothetical protein
MPATYTIGGTALSTYGLRLALFDGHHDQPGYKSIIEPNDLSAEMRKLKSRTVKVRLIGKYASNVTRTSQIELFKTKVKSAVSLEWIFSPHDFQEDCVMANGMTVNMGRDCIAVLSFELTIIES